jgi:hypothetical protein
MVAANARDTETTAMTSRYRDESSDEASGLRTGSDDHPVFSS